MTTWMEAEFERLNELLAEHGVDLAARSLITVQVGRMLEIERHVMIADIRRTVFAEATKAQRQEEAEDVHTETVFFFLRSDEHTLAIQQNGNYITLHEYGSNYDPRCIYFTPGDMDNLDVWWQGIRKRVPIIALTEQA